VGFRPMPLTLENLFGTASFGTIVAHVR